MGEMVVIAFRNLISTFLCLRAFLVGKRDLRCRFIYIGVDDEILDRYRILDRAVNREQAFS
jgi:hypothetical protein